MDDRTVTWTVLFRPDGNVFNRPLVMGMVDAHDYDHAETLFEEEFPNDVIMGIYPGDVSWLDAVSRYEEENAT